MKHFFVTGTGTDVGKTFISAGLAWQMSQVSKDSFIYIKPVASGVEKNNPDVEEVLKSIKAFSNAKAEGWFTYKEPAAPYIAAKSENKTLPYQEIIQRIASLKANYINMLIEGAGGVLVPLTENMMVIDLIVDLQLPVIVIGHYGLGTVNHTCLTIEALKRRKCIIAGVVLNQTQKIVNEEFRLAAETNSQEIERVSEVKVLGSVKYGEMYDSQNFNAIWNKLNLFT